MNVSEQKGFACELLEKLLLPALYKNFVENGKSAEFFSKAYERPELLEYIRDFEERTGCLVYYVIGSDTTMGYMYSLLYVSSYPEDWDHHLRYCKDGSFIVGAWVWNVDHEWCSEFGYIQVKSVHGFLERIA